LIIGEVIHIDDFGNIITNINEKDIQNGCKIVTMGAPQVSLKLIFDKTYAQAKFREPIAVVGSHGFVEIAVNQCNAAEKFHVKAGDKITFNAA
jgi:S-adenosylmethionine hydrolase